MEPIGRGLFRVLTGIKIAEGRRMEYVCVFSVAPSTWSLSGDALPLELLFPSLFTGVCTGRAIAADTGTESAGASTTYLGEVGGVGGGSRTCA